MEKFKSDFPVYFNEKDLVYFDSACVTLKPKVVIDSMREYYEKYPVCSGRSSHYLADKVDKKIYMVRNKLRNFFNSDFEEEFVFTRNTTESINLIASSYNFRGGYVVITDKEHNSNFLPWVRLEEEGKVKLKILETINGEFDLKSYQIFLEENDIELVAINYCSNIDGRINPVKKIIEIAHDNNSLVLFDCAQAAGHIRIDVKDLGVDFVAISGHKMLGPSGTGLLYVKRIHFDNMKPFLIGGDTVDDVDYPKYNLFNDAYKFEAGLLDYAGIIGLGSAIDYLDKHFDSLHKIVKDNLDYLFSEIEKLPVEIISSKDNNCGLISFIPNGIDAYELASKLSDKKICCRAGCFCVHNWFHKHNKTYALRISLNIYNDIKDCKYLIKCLKEILI